MIFSTFLSSFLVDLCFSFMLYYHIECFVFGLSVAAFILLSPPLEVSTMPFWKILPALSFLQF